MLGSRHEADDNLRMALAVKPLLEAAGHTVKLSRTTDVYRGIYTIADEANAWGANYFLDLHRNSGAAGATGIECLIRTNSSSTSRKLAEAILKRLVAVGGRNRGIKIQNDNTSSLNRTKMPGTIVELLFVSNPADNTLFDAKFQEYAKAITAGVVDLAGASSTSPTEPGGKLQGWKKEADGWAYYVDGQRQTGWQKLAWSGGSSWFYFDSSGYMHTGWMQINEKWYYLDLISGAMKTGWLLDKGVWYWLHNNGEMAANEFVFNANKWYYLDNKGVLLTNSTLHINAKGEIGTP